ncbi:hypothetical protein J4233_04310 [Candidatus Pacearchaeota archaeon]|nr:hypothetical protein [Candidatus Pacearchaeota archaeon]
MNTFNTLIKKARDHQSTLDVLAGVVIAGAAMSIIIPIALNHSEAHKQTLPPTTQTAFYRPTSNYSESQPVIYEGDNRR